jgi:hypothetical protein
LKETLDDYVRLTLKRALVSDAGTYCILAKNVYGCDRAFFTVKVKYFLQFYCVKTVQFDTPVSSRKIQTWLPAAQMKCKLFRFE